MERGPVGRARTVALAREARRLVVKAGGETLRFEQATTPITDEQIHSYLVHDDGFLRVPVLLIGDLLVRGDTEEIYREVLEPAADSSGIQ